MARSAETSSLKGTHDRSFRSTYDPRNSSSSGSFLGRSISRTATAEPALCSFAQDIIPSEEPESALQGDITTSNGKAPQDEAPEINPPPFDDILFSKPCTKSMNDKFQSLLPLLNKPDERNKQRLQETVKYIDTYRDTLISLAEKSELKSLYIHPPKDRKMAKKISPFHIEISIDSSSEPKIYILPKDHFLGRGSFKNVRVAIDYMNQKRVACATVKLKEEKEMARAIREYRIQQKFHLGQSFCLYFTEKNAKVKVMVPLANQGSLEQLLSPQGHAAFVRRFSPQVQQLILHKLIAFIHMLHEEDLVIADIKPHNILFNYNEEDEEVDIFITDFGTTYHKDDEEAERYVGSPCYMGPEFIWTSLEKNDKGINQSVDVFALGRTLWEIFVGGEPPWVIDIPRMALWYKPDEYEKSWSKFFKKFKKQLPKNSLEILILRMMDPSKERRPTMREIMELKPSLKLGSPSYKGTRLLTTRESLYRFKEVTTRWEKKWKDCLDPLKCYTLTINPKSRKHNSFYIEVFSKQTKNKFTRYKAVPCKDGRLKIYTSKKQSTKYEDLDDFIHHIGLEHCINFFV